MQKGRRLRWVIIAPPVLQARAGSGGITFVLNLRPGENFRSTTEAQRLSSHLATSRVQEGHRFPRERRAEGVLLSSLGTTRSEAFSPAIPRTFASIGVKASAQDSI